MKSSFSTPEFTSGVTATVPEPKPQTEDRTWGEFATDVAIDAAARPVVGALRTGAQAWRMAEDDPRGTGAAVEQGLGSADEWLKKQRSDRAEALDKQSIDPRGDERSFWKEPIAGSIHAMLPSVPYAAAALGTAGGSLAAQGATAAAMGAFGAGDALNDLRTYTDTEPLDNLKKSPVWEKLYREYNGDEKAARDALFKEMLDPKSQALNFLVNALEVPAFRLGMRPSGAAMRIADRAKAAGLGAVTGGTQGAIEGGTEAYVQQLGKVRSGQQQAINTDEIASGALKGGVFAGPMAAFHAVAPTYKKATPLGATEADVANQQINPQQERPPEGGPPGAAPPGAAPPGAASPGRQRGPVTDVAEEVAPPPVPPPGAEPVAAAPPSEPRPAPDVSEAVSIFKTAKGSEYFVMPDGTTIRNKAPRPEHPGEQGWQEPSQRTLFITPEHANELGGLFQATTTFAKRIAVLPDGRVGIQYMQGPSKGKFERRTVGRPLDSPQVGAMPLELWQNGGRAHFGNPITDVAHRPGTQQAAPQGEQFGPPTEPEGPQMQPPPRLPPGRMTWSSERGFTAPVSVMDRPPVFQNGQWLQPVAVRNPGTGQTHMMLAPIEELQAQAGPPAPGRTQEPPPVRTPEQPLAPRFPEVEQPGLPTPADFPGDELDLGTVAPPEPPTGTLSDNPVLRELQQRFARAKAEERETEQSAERARQRRVNVERRERMPETDWRDVRPAEQRRGVTPEVLRAARVAGEAVRRRVSEPRPTVSERLREKAAKDREQVEREGGQRQRRREFLTERQREERRREQAREGRAERTREQLAAEEAREAERKERYGQIERTHPLHGGEIRDPRLRRLQSDVQAFNVRAKELRESGRTLSEAERNDLRVDRQVLERRLAETEGADVLGLEPAGVEPHTVKLPTQEQRDVQEFRTTVEQLARLASQGELLHDGRPNTAAQQLVRKLENINYQRAGKRRVSSTTEKGEAIRTEFRGRKAPLPIPEALYDRLVATKLIKTPEQVATEETTSRQQTAALRQAVREQLDAEVGRRGTVGLKGTKLKSLAKRLQLKVGRETGVTRDREAWKNLTAVEKRDRRREVRVQEQRAIEEIIRETVADRLATAREREAAGKPPMHAGAATGPAETRRGGPAFVRDIPTAEEAIERFREGMREERTRTRGGEAVDRVRDKFVRDREAVAKNTIRDAIKKRFGTEKRFLDLLDKLSAVPPRPPRKPGGLNPNLDNAKVRTAVDSWQAAVDKWLTQREGQVADTAKLKKFLEHTIDRVRHEIDAYKKRQGISRADARNLAQPIWNANTGRFEFRSGVNEPARDYYNFANDLQKMNEALRAMRVGLGLDPAPGQKTKPVPLSTRILRSTGQRRLERGKQHAVGTPEMQTYFNEMTRYTGIALGEHMQDFVYDMKAFLKDDMTPIRERRAARVEEIDQQRGVSEAFGQKQEERVAEETFTEQQVQREAELGGGSLAARTGRNVMEERMLGRAEAQRKLIETRDRAEHGADYDRVMRERQQEMRSQFPVRRTSREQLRKVRPGLPDFDEKGLPTNRLGPHKEFTGYSEEEQRHLDAHDQINNDPAPTHALISPSERTQSTVDRIKDMVAKGQTGIVPEQYVTNDFLDRLAAITRDTEVVHAPYDVVSGLGDDSSAHYNTRLDRVVLPSDVSPDLYVRAALHENVHAATERSLLTDPVMRGEVNDLLQLAVAAAERRGIDPDRLPRDMGGLINASEFVTETVSNKKFREFLYGIPAPHSAVIQGAKNVLNAVYRTIRNGLRRIFGNAKDGDTALDILFYDQSTVLGQADALIKRSMKRLERQGRPDRAAAVRALDEGDGRRYLTLSDGARAFRDGLTGTYDRAAFQLGQVKNENRAPGISWRSMFDQTKIGSEEFKGLTGNLFRTFEEMHGKVTALRDADKREIADLASIWNKFTKEGREQAGKFMIDEGMHTAWADAPLDEHGPEYLDQATGERKRDRVGKNAHIDPTSLRDAQVVHQHAALQRELQRLEASLPGFKEFRDRTYAFTAKREQDIRRNRYRDTFATTDFMPENVEGKARDRLLDAFERWVDPDQKSTPADIKVFKDAGVRLNDPKLVEHRDLVRDTKEFQKIIGPYSPFTRYGDWALSGRFKIDKPENALVLKEDINEATGQPIDDARFVFPTSDEAREMVHKVSDELGIAQLDGGTIWIDTTTGQRPRVPDKRHEGKERLATESEIANHPNAEKIEQYHYVSFQPKLLEMHPDQFTANENMKAWLEDPRYKGKIEITKPKDVFRHDGRQNEHYVSTQLQQVLNHIRASNAFQKLDANEQAAVTRNMNLASEQYVMRRGFKQRQLPRNYVKGASTHVLASLDDYSTTSARYLGKVQYGSQLKAESEKIKGYLKDHEYDQGDRNAVAQNRVYAAMMRRIHNPTRNPHENFVSRWIDRAMRITMLDKLPNVAYFTVNATETGAIGLPLMIGRHGVANAATTMAKYYKVAGVFGRFRKAAQNDIMQAFKRGTKMTNFVDLFSDAINQAGNKVQFADGLKDLIRQAAGRNHFDVSASLEYQSSFPTSRKGIDVGLDYGQGLFQSVNTAIENMNRFVTLGTAYDLEMRRLLDVAAGRKKERTAGEAGMATEQRHQAAADYAMDMLHQANGVYASYNAPEMFTREGPLGMFGPMVFQFKKWPQRITMIYLRTGLGMLKGIAELARGGRMSPEHKEAARQFVAMVAMVGLVAGALGMPTEPFSAATNIAFMTGLSPYNWNDAEAGFRAWLAKHGGRDMAQFVAHGPLSFFTGVDFAGRMSQSQMWAFGSPASNKPRDLYASLLGLIGGATFGTASEVLQGFQKGAEGVKAMSDGADSVAYKKFGESAKHLALIRFVADTLGSFMGAEGTELSSGRKLGPTLTPWERLVKAGGFQPTREAEAREARAAITSMEKRETAGRKTYVDEFVQSPPGLQRERVWQNVQQNWNPSHPGMEITQSDLLKALNTREKAKAEDRGLLGIPQNRTTRALMPMAEAYGYR
jgi:hypothetical protein